VAALALTAGSVSCESSSAQDHIAAGAKASPALTGCRKNLSDWLKARVDLLEHPFPDDVAGWLETAIYSGVNDVYVPESVLGWLAAFVNNRASADAESAPPTGGLTGAGAVVKAASDDQANKDHKARLKVWFTGRVSQLSNSTPWLHSESGWLKCGPDSIVMGGPDPDDPMPPPPIIGGLSRLFIDKVGAMSMSHGDAETLGNDIKAALSMP